MFPFLLHLFVLFGGKMFTKLSKGVINVSLVESLHLHRLKSTSNRPFANNLKNANTSPLELIRKTLSVEKIPHNATILMCVSGGCDSVAMLHLMNTVKRLHLPYLQLKVVNFNHKQRIEADEEAEFVANLASFYENEMFVRELPAELRARNFSQAVGREWRRCECQSILDVLPGTADQKFVATAHHKDDQIETLLMKLFRGVHISNLSMMKPLAGEYLKPMLEIRKSDIIKYLEEHNLEWREDSSNSERVYKRNKVRLDLIPLLSELTGGDLQLEKRLSLLSVQSAQVRSLLEQQVIEVARCLQAYSFSDYHVLGFHNVLSLYGHRVEELSPMVLQQIVRSWIFSAVGMQANDNTQLSRVTELLTMDMKSRKSAAITISDDWDVIRIGKELRLAPRPRSSSKSCLPNKTTRVIHANQELVIHHTSDIQVRLEPLESDFEETAGTYSATYILSAIDDDDGYDDCDTSMSVSRFFQRPKHFVDLNISLPISHQSQHLTVRRYQSDDDKELFIATRKVFSLLYDKKFCGVENRDRFWVILIRTSEGKETCVAAMTEKSTYTPPVSLQLSETYTSFPLRVKFVSGDDSKGSF